MSCTKKMKRNIVIIISILTVLFSCNERKLPTEKVMKIAQTYSEANTLYNIPNDDFTVLDVDNAKSMYMYELTDKVEDIKYVYLKTEEPIGEIRQILVHQGRIFILDAFVSESVFIFDMEGNLVNIISDKGGGPKEYFGLGENMVIKNEELIVSDRLKTRRLYYSLDGNYIRTEECLPCRTFETINDKFILCIDASQTWDNEIQPQLVISTGFSALRVGLDYHSSQKNSFAGKFHVNSQNELLFCPILCDTIYQILSDSTFSPKYFIKNKKSLWGKADLNLNNNELNQLVSQEGFFQFQGDFQDTKDNIFLGLIQKDPGLKYQNTKWYWYNKTDKTVYESKNIDITAPDWLTQLATHDYHMLSKPIASWNSYYIGYFFPEQIGRFRNSFKKNKKTDWAYTAVDDDWREIMLMDDDPNQALVFFKLNFDRKNETLRYSHLLVMFAVCLQRILFTV